MVCSGPPALFGLPDGNASAAADAALAAIIRTFLGLTDTPSTYAGQTLKGVRVNASETALEFASLVQTFVGLTDGPGTFTGNTLKGVRVNAGETALEYYTRLTAFTQLTDVPASYSGQANKFLVVGAAETGVEFSSTSAPTSPLAAATGQIRSLLLPGIAALASTGTAGNTNGTLSNPALVSTSLLASSWRLQIKATSSAAGNLASSKVPQLIVTRGSSAGAGGLKFAARWATSTAVAQQRSFVGVISQTADIANVNPSTLTDLFGVSYNSAGTQLLLTYNDGSGTATQDTINGGTGFPVDATTVYELVFSCAPNSSTIEYVIRNLSTGASESGQKTSNLPTNTVGLAPHMWVNNGTTAQFVQIDLFYMQLGLYA